MIPVNIIIFLVSFLTCFVVIPFLIRKFKEKDEKPYVVPDMYKKDKSKIPNLGGLGILFGVIAGLIVAQLLIVDVNNLMIFYFVVIVYAIFTLIDDLIDVGRKSKIFIPFFLALPIALLNIDTTFSFYFFELDMGVFFSYVIAPVYLMVVANLINMHSGFNGLQTGLSGILLTTIAIKVIMRYGWETTHFIMPVLAAVLAFWYFDRYPSKIFLGNVGSYTIGPAVGGLLILNNMEFFGMIILLPHIVNFLMAVYSEIVKKYKKKANIFAKLRKDGTIEAPDYPALKWLLARYFKLTEKQLTYLMYLFTIVFCGIGLILF